MISKQTILDLARESNDICISIYLPTHKMGEEVQQDPIRYKNLLVETEKKLKEYEVHPQDIEDLLEEPRKLLDQPIFWQHNDEGLAIFITSEGFDYHRVPYSFSEKVMVDDHFLITPLVPMISLEGVFCVLTLSQKNVRLLKCTRNSAETIKLKEAATSMEEFLKYHVEEPGLQHHAGQGTGRAKAQANFHSKGDIFHGHGAEGDTDQREAVNYLNQIENEVTSILRKQYDPLILIGGEQAVAEYKKVNKYERLLDDAITRNPDDLKDEEVKEKGWEIIKSFFLQDMYNDMERFADLTGSDKQSDNLTRIVEASYYGKVDSLFVPIGENSWGWFDEERDHVHHSAKPQNGEHDLINMAAIKTLTQGGDVYALDKENMPNGSSIAAIFRYS